MPAWLQILHDEDVPPFAIKKPKNYIIFVLKKPQNDITFVLKKS